MDAVAAVHNYDTPMLIYGSDTLDDGKPSPYILGDIARPDTASVSMEKLAHDLTEKKLVGAYWSLLYHTHMRTKSCNHPHHDPPPRPHTGGMRTG